MVQPLRPIGDASGLPAAPKPQVPPSGAGEFPGLLADRLKGDPRLGPVLRYAEAALGGPAASAKLLETYDALSADQALFEVQTVQGRFRVIQSRSGSFSHYPA